MSIISSRWLLATKYWVAKMAKIWLTSAPLDTRSPPGRATRDAFKVYSIPGRLADQAQRWLRHQPGLLLAVAIYLGLAFSYFFIVPIFEAPDEWTHTGHVKHIAEGNGLPVMLPGQGIWGGQQPPLYYLGGALLVQPFELAAFDDYADQTRNPHASLGYALDPGNKNNYLHAPSENFPYRGLALTVHLLRLYSMGFGLVALFFTYLTALELAQASRLPGRHPRPASSASFLGRLLQPAPLFATAVALVVASQPMFDFITASVANEPANIALCALGLWLVQRYVLYGPSPHWSRAVALGMTLGLISLAKMTGLALGLVAVGGMLQTALAYRRQPGAARWLWRDGLIIGGMFLLVGGWWYWRNYQLYGDFFQQGLYKIYFNVDPQPLSLDKFLFILSSGEISFWATFGWLNIVGPDWLYSFYRIVSRLGLLGLALAALLRLGRWLWPRLRPIDLLPTPPAALLIHLVFPVSLAFSLTRLVAIEGGIQGRQLLPALGSIAILMVWGWWGLSPGRLRPAVVGLLVAAMLAVAVWLPYGLVRPAYHPRPLLSEMELPPDLTPLNIGFAGQMKLLGVEIEVDTVRPGERVPVTAYWQVLQPMETNYSVFVHLIGRAGQTVGQFNSYPGLGLRPTSGLQPGQIVVDTYPVLVEGGSQAPSRLLVNVGLFNFHEPGRPGVQSVAADGSPVQSTVGQLKLVPHQWPTYEGGPPLAQFGDQIWLADSRRDGCQPASSDCRLILTWLAQGQPAQDYTIFIQLWQNGELMAGFDSPPLNNDYPTSLWQAGELIVDPHRLDLTGLEPGRYRLLVGLYHRPSEERLPASQEGRPLPDKAVELKPLIIE